MDEVQFDEPKYRTTTNTTQRNLFVDFLVNKGVAKNKQQATYILFGIIGVCILIMFIFFGGKSDQRSFSETEIKILEQAGSPLEMSNQGL